MMATGLLDNAELELVEAERVAKLTLNQIVSDNTNTKNTTNNFPETFNQANEKNS